MKTAILIFDLVGGSLIEDRHQPPHYLLRQPSHCDDDAILFMSG
jgi:hypothetical protein